MNKEILDLLKCGGYLLYTRHGEATVGTDQPDLNLQDCSTQRNLSDTGRNQAFYYGQLLRYYQIPIVYPIQASPFCRAIETAHLAFGNVPIQADPYWYYIDMLSENLSADEVNYILSFLPSRLEIKPPMGFNRVIIAHGFPEGIGLGQLSEMETVIIKPLGPGRGYEIVGKYTLSDLAD